ncbi:MAG: Uma2 family endonuclease [Puia sp.]|nr:Uma2 family endonuclease [Puia sp.]
MLTIYNVDDDSYQTVEEPDPSLVYTYADYMRWKFEERLELFRGKIFKMGVPNTAHQVVGGRLFNELYNHLKGQVCRVFVAPYDIRLPVKNRKRDDEITTSYSPMSASSATPRKSTIAGYAGRRTWSSRSFHRAIHKRKCG